MPSTDPSTDPGDRHGDRDAATPLHDIVTLACRAPSVHNTQPWRWRAAGTGISLYADPTRRLDLVDPAGRNLTISCGAALHHAQVAARGLGWQSLVRRLPDPDRADLLAHLTLVPRRRTEADVDALGLLARRTTDRRRFTSWPVRADRLVLLTRAAASWGATALPLDDPDARARVVHLMTRAHLAQSADRAVVHEHHSWLDRSVDDGVRSALVPGGGSGPDAPPPRLDEGTLQERGRPIEGADSLLVLATDGDDPLDWLRTGEALSALWLAAVREGLSVVPLSQVTEVAETREALRHDVLHDSAVPQLLLRVGWQSIGRSELPGSPRRPLVDVLLS